MNIVIFSGAGISAESGIQTFRDSDGLWEKYNIEEIATPQAWDKNPDLVTHFYNERRKRILDVEPDQAHKEIAQLEKGFNVQVITQNIDDYMKELEVQTYFTCTETLDLAKVQGQILKRITILLMAGK